MTRRDNCEKFGLCKTSVKMQAKTGRGQVSSFAQDVHIN